MHAVFGPIIHARHSNFPKTQPDIAPSRGAAGRACTELGAQRSWRRLIGSARGSSEHPVIVWYGGSLPRLKLARAGRRHTHLRPISALGGRHNVDCVERRRAPLGGTSGRPKPLPPATAHLLSFCEARQRRAVCATTAPLPGEARESRRAPCASWARVGIDRSRVDEGGH
jgi:hypothetical protein